jgi:hypothetical protein
LDPKRHLVVVVLSAIGVALSSPSRHGDCYVFVADSSGAITFLHSGGRSWRQIK